MARSRKVGKDSGGQKHRGVESSLQAKRKNAPQVPKGKTLPQRTIDEDTTSSSDDEVEVSLEKHSKEKHQHPVIAKRKKPPKRTILEEETNSEEEAQSGDIRQMDLEKENECLRKKIRQMQEAAIKEGVENKINSVQKTLMGTYVKETLFRRVKFVDHRKLNSGSNIMNLCFSSIPLHGDDRIKYSSHVKKLLRHYLSQRRNYVAQQLKKCVIGKYPIPAMVTNCLTNE